MKNNILEDLESKAMAILPSEERRKKGPYALFECFQCIPCNPCYTSCKFHAVKPFTNITDTPQIDYNKCVGCGICITVCPGLAACVVDETFSATESLIKIPYEYLPLPKEGQILDGVNRIGEPVCKVKVEKVIPFKNKTNIISIVVPKAMTHIVRGIQLKPRVQAIFEDIPKIAQGESIVCRCEDVTEKELQMMLEGDANSLKQIKLQSRATMGPCQGKTCIPLILRELSGKTKQPIDNLTGPKYRQPIKPIKIASFLDVLKDTK